MWNEINQVIEQHVQPVFNAHGGYVKPIDYTDGILRIAMKGRCSNCPSAVQETEEIVKLELQKHMEGIQDVILVNEVSDELVEFAKIFLNQSKEKN